MAFTVSHAVLAPLIARIFRFQLPVGALAIGCMAPDLYRLFTHQHYFEPHQWQHIFSVTLWIGLFFCLIWYGFYRQVLYRMIGLQDPLNIDSFKDFIRFTLANAIAVVIGICTHLIWDGLTHVDFRTFAFHDFLATKITVFNYTFPMHRLMQIGSSALVLPVMLWMSWRYYKAYKQHFAVPKPIKQWRTIIFTLSLTIGLFSAFDYLHHIPSKYFSSGLYSITGRAINEFSQDFLISFSLGCILFLFLDRDKRLG